jgi:hypothetical protein
MNSLMNIKPGPNPVLLRHAITMASIECRSIVVEEAFHGSRFGSRTDPPDHPAPGVSWKSTPKIYDQCGAGVDVTKTEIAKKIALATPRGRFDVPGERWQHETSAAMTVQISSSQKGKFLLKSPRTFAEELRWHLENGTRPEGKFGVPGKRWRHEMFASEASITYAALRKYISRNSSDCRCPFDLKRIEKALFGGNSTYEPYRRALREAHQALQNDSPARRRRRCNEGGKTPGAAAFILAALRSRAWGADLNPGPGGRFFVLVPAETVWSSVALKPLGMTDGDPPSPPTSRSSGVSSPRPPVGHSMSENRSAGSWARRANSGISPWAPHSILKVCPKMRARAPPRGAWLGVKTSTSSRAWT